MIRVHLKTILRLQLGSNRIKDIIRKLFNFAAVRTDKMMVAAMLL